MQKMARLSVAVVLLIIIVPLCIYSYALFVGIELGRALERSPDSSVHIVSARGVVGYLAKLQPRARGVIRLGPWGGYGGQPFSMCGQQSPPRLRSIDVYYSSAIHALTCECSVADVDDDRLERYYVGAGLPHSFGKTAARAAIILSAGEHITAVEGTTGRFGNVPGVVITSLKFRTSAGRTYGPYGGRDGACFSVPVPSGGSVAGFWGRSGWLIDAIGVYIQPRTAVSRSYYYDRN